MNCDKIKKLLNPYIDQVLDAESMQTIEEHLKSCPTCQDEYLKLKEMVASFKLLPQVDAPQDLTQSIMAKILKEEIKVQTSWIDHLKKQISHPRLSFRLVGATATAVLVVFFAFTFFFNSPDTSPICSAEVKFSLRLNDNQPHTVAIAGDFNNWNPQANILEDPERDGVWTGTLKLEPGRYEYMFVMDGEKWFPDPNALRYVKDGFGNKNAILEINNCNTT
ncbi:MAG TPA: hypothetical protein ENO17_07230 [Candidatus Atribacteria bacterium]|nr:hypothetical protein [Candidatus Atribacteria bacterium]